MLFRLFSEIIPLSTVNVALGKPALQSSTDHGGLASRAVDGDINSNWGGSSCTHTAHESEPWFRVDLQLSVFVGQVVLYNRVDCCTGRLNNYLITVGNDINGADNSMCTADGGDVSRMNKVTNNCDPPLLGRYVHVRLKRREALTICEILVYAVIGENSHFD